MGTKIILLIIFSLFLMPLATARNYGEGRYGYGLYGIGEEEVEAIEDETAGETAESIMLYYKKCGDGICQEYENMTICPKDCLETKEEAIKETILLRDQKKSKAVLFLSLLMITVIFLFIVLFIGGYLTKIIKKTRKKENVPKEDIFH